MIFVLGGATYGLARLFRGAWWVSSGWGWAHGNGGGAPPSRPDILGSAGVAWLFRPSGEPLGSGPVRQLAGAVLSSSACWSWSIRRRTSSTSSVWTRESTEELLDETETQSSQGGSEFENERVVVVDPLATGTILFRPYLWEASGTGQLSPPSRGRCSWRSSSTPATS